MSFSVVEDLLLVRLLALPKSKPGPKQVRDQLYVFFQNRFSPGEWNSVFEETSQRLDQQQLIGRRPYSLSEAGRRRAMDFLGVDSLPAKVTWKQLTHNYLTAKACGFSPDSAETRQKISDTSRLLGTVVQQGQALATPDFPTLKQAIDALAWRQLGVETNVPFTEKNVLRHLLGDDLQTPSKLALPQLRRQFAAQTLNIPQGGVEQVRQALLARLGANANANVDVEPFPDMKSPRPVEVPAVAAPAPAVQPLAADLKSFSQRVRQVALEAMEGRHGERNVFINRIWRRMQNENAAEGMNLDQFKRRLTEANREGHLSLSRADLVSAMDPQDVAESETHYLNAAFHFVQIS